MEDTNGNWYKNLITECNSMSERFGLDDMATKEMRDFIVFTAKEQYKHGNKSGIRWAYGKMKNEPTKMPV